MQKQRMIILIIAVVLAFLAAIMAKSYIEQQVAARDEERKKILATQQSNQAVVMVAKDEIAKGTVINAEMLETAIVPNEYIQPRAVANLDRISGMVAVAPISKGEQITLSKLSQVQEVAKKEGGLSGVTPIGKRAITISVDNISSLLGMIKPGDYVDVISMVPIPSMGPDGKQSVQPAVVPIFQNVLVLAVGQSTGEVDSGQGEGGRYQPQSKGDSSMITLALSPKEANLIAFIQEQGKIRLVLRSPADGAVEDIQPADWSTFFQHIMPGSGMMAAEPGAASQEEIQAPQTSQQEEAEVKRFVEIYRGLNKEVVALTDN